MKPRYLFGLAGLVLLYGLFAYHQNFETAASMSHQIVTADGAGQSVTSSLAELETYVHRHLGTTTTVILSGSYDRAAALAKTTTLPATNGQIYSDAQAACAGHDSSVAQAQCVTAYVSARLAAPASPTATPAPTQAAFTYHYKAPLWTPDATGLALAIAAILALAGGAIRSSQRR